MTIRRMEHIGIVVDDLAAATEFFVQLGFELVGEGSVEGDWVDRVLALEGVRSQVTFLQTPDGHAQLELSKFHHPPMLDGDSQAPMNARGIRHIAFSVDDLDAVVAGLRARGVEFVGEVERYEDIWLVCFVRGPEGIIVELGQRLS